MAYAIKDVITGKIYSNLAGGEVAKKLNVSLSHVHRVASEQLLINKRFEVFRCEGNLVNKSQNNIPKELLSEWDNVCSKFRIYYGNNLEVNE